MIVVNLTSRCTGVHDDVSVGARLRQVLQGEPSTGFRDNDDDEHIVQCLQHVKRYLF
jgi:hypothetical protein